MSFGELITKTHKQNFVYVDELPKLPISAFSLFDVALWANKLEVTVRQIIAMKVLLKSWLIEGKSGYVLILSKICLCTEVLVDVKWESEQLGFIAKLWISGKHSRVCIWSIIGARVAFEVPG